MAYEIRREDLEPLLLGAAFFGSGGGGTIESARHLAAHFVAGDYYPTDTVKVVSVGQADFANRMVYSGTKRKMLDLVKPDIKPFLPDINDPNGFYINLDYWKDKQMELEKRFKEWLVL